MAEINIKFAKNSEYSPAYDPYSMIRIKTGKNDDDGKEIVYEAGNSTGRVLEITNEWGTQEQANALLENLKGKKYAQLSVSGAVQDPAASIGDTVSFDKKTSAIGVRTTNFGKLLTSDVSLPVSEEIDHEIPYESKTSRSLKREEKEITSSFKVMSTQISAKVGKSGGSSDSFGWTLTAENWKCLAGSEEVFVANSEGIHVKGDGTFTGKVYAENGEFDGKITATEGTFRGTVYAEKFYMIDGGAMATDEDVERILGSYTSRGSGGCGKFGDMMKGIWQSKYILGKTATISTVTATDLYLGYGLVTYGGSKLAWNLEKVVESVEITKYTANVNVMTKINYTTGAYGYSDYWGDYTPVEYVTGIALKNINYKYLHVVGKA